MEPELNKLLLRQLKRRFGSSENIPEELRNIIRDISETYDNFEGDAFLLQNSIEISSQELRDAYQKHKLDAEAQKETISKIKEAIAALEPSVQNVNNRKEASSASSGYLIDSLIKLIEERKQAEEALQQSNQKWEAIISASPDGIGMASIDGKIQLMTGKLALMYGYTPEEKEKYLGESILRFIDPSNHDLLMENISKLLAGESDNKITEYLAVKKDNSRFYVDVKSSILIDAKGNPASILFVQRDITDRKLSEETLNNERSLFRTIIDLIPDAVYVKDTKGRKVLANPTEVQFSGVNSEAELIGKTDFEIHPGTEAERSRLEEQYVLLTGKPVLNVDGTLIDREGQRRWLLVSKVPLFDVRGMITGIVGVTHDITERKLVEQELVKSKEKAEESDRLKSAFLANMSHEIRTPMNGILGFAALLKEPKLSGEEQLEYIRIIEKSGARMLNIINDIIDISKIESGQMEVMVSEADINEQIDYVYNFFRPEAENKGLFLHLHKTLPQGSSIIRTDQEKLYAILTNLVKNAVKYTSRGTIDIGYELQGDFLKFFVKDTGIGIYKTRLKAIFERFIQADISNKQAVDGAGLGLSITRAYVEMLDGKIWVESEVGKGSEFYFTIPYNPVSDVKKEIKPLLPESYKPDFLRSLKILIVEDDEASGKFISIAVKSFCSELLKARTGQDAVAVCHDNPDIDLVLMDIRLPEMSGYEASRRIREFNKKVIIIAQTAYGLFGDREKALDAGCNDYISKPIEATHLIELIKEHFSE